MAPVIRCHTGRPREMLDFVRIHRYSATVSKNPNSFLTRTARVERLNFVNKISYSIILIIFTKFILCSNV